LHRKPSQSPAQFSAGANNPSQLSRKFIFVNRFFYPDHSATAQMLSDLAFTLAEQGERIAIIASRQTYQNPRANLPARELIRGVEVHRIATTNFGRGALGGRAVDISTFYATAALKLLELAKEGDVIVAKTDPPLLSLVVHRVAALKRARLVNWLQDVYPEVARELGVRALGGAVGGALTAWRNQSLMGAHKNIVLGERMAEHLQTARVPSAKIAIIPNWSDEEAISPLSHTVNSLRAQWGLEGKYVVGYSGNLGRAHEYATMLGAAKRLKDDPDIVFLMIGGGHHVDGLQSAATSAGLSNLLFKPYQPLSALSASLSTADIHWISLRPEVEGLIVPSKVYGILAAGRPILAVTDPNGEIARLVRSQGCGLQVSPGDAVGFADAVQFLARNPDRAAVLGAAARTAAVTTYSRRKSLSKWRDVLHEAAAV
jgi:colanic acid biosynthesis glycosyl transferase WcaI